MGKVLINMIIKRPRCPEACVLQPIKRRFAMLEAYLIDYV